MILTDFDPLCFHLFITQNQGRTAGRTHLDHVRLSLSILLTNPFGCLTGNKLNSTTPKTSLTGRGAVLVTAGSPWHITNSISGTGISVQMVPHLHWIRQRQCDDQTAWPDMIHPLMRVKCQSSVIGSSFGVYVLSCFILTWINKFSLGTKKHHKTIHIVQIYWYHSFTDHHILH